MKHLSPIIAPIVSFQSFPKVSEQLKTCHFTSLFTKNMSGFLRGHSFCTALLKLTEEWRQALDLKKDVGVIAVDLSKASDSKCHNLLLAKLRAYGRQDSRQPVRPPFFNIFINDVNTTVGTLSIRR